MQPKVVDLWGGGATIPVRRLLRSVALQLFLILSSALFVYPFIWLIVSSLKSDAEIFFDPWALPQLVHFDNYFRAWNDAHIGEFFLNSALVVGVALVGNLFVGAMAAYVFARFDFRLKRAIFFLILAGMMFPQFLVLVPLFFLVSDLGLLDTLPGLSLVYVAFSLPFSIFFLTSFFQTIPKDFADVAIVDGATEFQVFRYVMLPLARPGVLSVGIFTFIGMWNEFLLPLVLIQDTSRYVVSQGLAFLSIHQYYSNDWSGLFAALTIVTLPTLVAYAVFSGRIREGLTMGGLSG